MSLSLIKYPQTGGAGESLRFGFAGEDDVAAELRNFQTAGNDFWISNSSQDNVYMALWGGTDIDLWSSDPTDNQISTELYLTPTTLSIWLSNTSDLEIGGIDQDDTVTKVLGITSGSDLVRWIDKSVLVSAPTYARLTSPFLSAVGTSGGGSIFYDITGLSIALLANSTYEVESEIFFKDNGSGGVREYLLNFSTSPVSGGVTYQLTGVQGLTGIHTDSVTFGNTTVGSSDWTTHFTTDFSAATISSSVLMWSLKIKALITTAGSATTMKIQAGLFGGNGNWVAGVGSFMKATKIA